MRLLRLLVAASAALAPALLVAPTAHAQTATPASPEWGGRPSTALQLNEINQADCLASNATITFNVTVTTGTSTSTVLQVWAGTACGTKANRDKNTGCNMVYEADAETQNVTVKVKDILQEAGEGKGIDTGTEETCRPSSGASGGVKHSLFFLIIDQSTGEAVGTGGQWEFTYDLVPPDPPSDVTAGPGENSLTLDFTEPDDDDLDR
jgi:hypothetical protein